MTMPPCKYRTHTHEPIETPMTSSSGDSVNIKAPGIIQLHCSHPANIKAVMNLLLPGKPCDNVESVDIPFRLISNSDMKGRTINCSTCDLMEI